jgi:hypothetical protein
MVQLEKSVPPKSLTFHATVIVFRVYCGKEKVGRDGNPKIQKMIV